VALTFLGVTAPAFLGVAAPAFLGVTAPFLGVPAFEPLAFLGVPALRGDGADVSTVDFAAFVLALLLAADRAMLPRCLACTFIAAWDAAAASGSCPPKPPSGSDIETTAVWASSRDSEPRKEQRDPPDRGRAWPKTFFFQYVRCFAPKASFRDLSSVSAGLRTTEGALDQKRIRYF